ncbi:MAG TPA: LysR substrate-binding domain-containing protein [Sphingomicrobium sp.]|nr:LysR substrate-binding domain-containing protein [Sphingomicrobium sp.]
MFIPASLLSDLPALLVIAEEAHFGRAAERLNVSQPRVSQIIRRVEGLLGYELFKRRPHVRLTEAGEFLIKAARQALEDFDDAFLRAADLAAGRAGTVRVGYSPVAMLTDLPSRLKAFREQNPGVMLQLHEAYSAYLWAGLEAGRFDVIVGREARDLPGIRSHLFHRDGMVAVLPADDVAARESELSVAALADRDFIAIDEAIAPQWYHAIASVCRSAGFELRVAQRANDWDAILALVASGLGVSIVSSTLAQLRFPGVKFVGLSEGVGAGAFWVAYRDAAADPAVKLLRSELLRP